MGKTVKKILIYSPYWSKAGGGERYLLQIAFILQKNYRIYLLADKIIKKKARHIFGLNLDQVEFLEPGFFRNQNFFSRYLFLRQFDICFYTTDGSLFFPASPKNYLVIQSPLHIPPPGFTSKLKIKNWKIVCYSGFMRKIISDRLGKDSFILPPAVDTDLFMRDKVKKEKIILTVGRFFSSPLHEKRQDFLLDFFIKNYQKYFRNWQLIICGNLTEQSGNEFLIKLKKKIKGYPVKLMVNLPFTDLKHLYKKSSLYWHAAGYGSDPQKLPEKMEHFGITTLEAMAASAVPLVFAAGGQTDIVVNGKSGFLWPDEAHFLKYNRQLLDSPTLLKKMAQQAGQRSFYFSLSNFEKRLHEII
ncbi:hypothetical protein A2W14_01950 [Candidatus Gottesmanbacteria bacterium RBG_16_37_8]|uniref:Glycosyl transferase family 1 domain-containing protein n=1 Tax=Candidatus Gottesmanbacteria bacterium RBG_16_37_8 TaxID=1798371 RepID=A0A1F5YW52_9BACT|nr:MAG: hypothetical protein A2W14_01950 [Candidatus Gottesmanbacteria bacterium RBG_16_37_8]